MKLSIVVPIYNAEEYLEECIESIINQTFHDFELILVNDGSKDNSLLIAKKWANKDIRIKIIDKENEGVSSARNQGIKIAQGEYIGFVDSDDYINAYMYEKLIKSIEDTNSDIAICKRVIPGREKNYGHEYPNGTLFSFANNKESWKKKFYQGDTETFVTNKLFRTEFLRKIGVRFKRYSLFEDRLYLMELYLGNPRLIYVNEELYYYRPVEGSSVQRYYAQRFLIIKEIYKCELELNRKFENNEYLQVIDKSLAESISNCIIQEKQVLKKKDRTILYSIRCSEEFQNIYKKIDSLNLNLTRKKLICLLYEEKYALLYLWLEIMFLYDLLKSNIKKILRRRRK